ncbi:MAG: hypothetical protein JO206_12060, partial [Solirubrobacterales bacterium]|nr:hypothetical protein [Solirubrobacterales bacterium]
MTERATEELDELDSSASPPGDSSAADGDAGRRQAEGSAEPELDPEVVARRNAALAQVRKFGDPVLRTRARPVDRFDDALRSEIARMGALMDDALGV